MFGHKKETLVRALHENVFFRLMRYNKSNQYWVRTTTLRKAGSAVAILKLCPLVFRKKNQVTVGSFSVQIRCSYFQTTEMHIQTFTGDQGYHNPLSVSFKNKFL